MSWVGHSSVVTPCCYIHGKGNLMQHHLVGATVQVANVVNYNCDLQEDGNNSNGITA